MERFALIRLDADLNHVGPYCLATGEEVVFDTFAEAAAESNRVSRLFNVETFIKRISDQSPSHFPAAKAVAGGTHTPCICPVPSRLSRELDRLFPEAVRLNDGVPF